MAFQIFEISVTTLLHNVSGIEALCIILRRLVYFNRSFETSYLLGRLAVSLGTILTHTFVIVHEKHVRFLEGKLTNFF